MITKCVTRFGTHQNHKGQYIIINFSVCSTLSVAGRAGKEPAGRRAREQRPRVGHQHNERHTEHGRVVGEAAGQLGRAAARRRGGPPGGQQAKRQLSVASVPPTQAQAATRDMDKCGISDNRGFVGFIDVRRYEDQFTSPGLRSPKFVVSPEHISFRGFWTYPYFSCGLRRWLVSYSIAIPPLSRHE